MWGEGYVGVNGDSKFVGDGGGLIFRILQVVTVVGYGLEIVGYVSYTNDRPANGVDPSSNDGFHPLFRLLHKHACEEHVPLL